MINRWSCCYSYEKVFVEPPSDVKKQGIIWKLMKPLYRLDNTSRKFWLRVKDVFYNKFGLKTVEGDEAFYSGMLTVNSVELC